jgi:hypothetical protein
MVSNIVRFFKVERVVAVLYVGRERDGQQSSFLWKNVAVKVKAESRRTDPSPVLAGR